MTIAEIAAPQEAADWPPLSVFGAVICGRAARAHLSYRMQVNSMVAPPGLHFVVPMAILRLYQQPTKSYLKIGSNTVEIAALSEECWFNPSSEEIAASSRW